MPFEARRKECEVIMEERVEEFLSIEDEFFHLDHENKIAYMELEFETPKEIFDFNAVTKIPLINDDFMDWIKYVLDMAPRKYSIDISISFCNMDGYSSEYLKNAFLKNSVLEFKRMEKRVSKKNHIAVWLIILGVLLLISTIFLTGFWKEDGVIKQVVTYILDIATTVTVWEGLTILVVDSTERRSQMKNILSRVKSIRFQKL